VPLRSSPKLFSVSDAKRPSAPALLWHQTRYELRTFIRTPISAFFTLIFPLMIFIVFALLFGNEEIEYLGINTAQYYAPSLAVYAAVASSYVNIGISTAYQRDEGILKRAKGTPLPPWLFLGGKVVAGLVVATVATIVMLAVGVIFYGVEIYPEAIPSLVLTFIVGVACFAALGLLVAAVAPSGSAATAIANATLLPLAFISGVFIVPSEAPPAWLDAVANFFPLKHFAEPFIAGFNPVEDVSTIYWGDLAYMALWGAVGLFLAVRFFKWEPSSGESRRPWRRRKESATA
jgi:ABC-2 type transport system permease protein